jgi:nucleoside-diphosphate-sugar epimerase
MRLLVLGGGQFVGPAFVDDALARDWDVTVANRGLSSGPREGVRHVVVDRTTAGALDDLARESFDVVVDTWSGAPHVVRDAARALSAGTGRWVYVSSRSVYAWPPAAGGDESAPVVDADPDADATQYPADKRGAELALDRELGPDRAVLLRAGLILGPGENVGRLPWWLRRMARGGRVLVPGSPDLAIQHVDARDLAALGLDAATAGRSGPVDVVSPVGTATLGDVLLACAEITGGGAELDWVDDAFLTAAGVEYWTELPIWIPPDDEAYALHQGEVSRALAWGLRIRPVRETVSDTWDWVSRVDADGSAPSPRDGIGMSPEREVDLLARWDASAGR